MICPFMAIGPGYQDCSEVNQLRSDLAASEKAHAETRAKLERVTEALTPGVDTKESYNNEFWFKPPGSSFKVRVPWDTIKEIMAAIRQYAAIGEKGGI